MPLHVNLYHEVQRQELARRRDPLRLGMLGLLVIAVGFVVNYFIVLGQAHVVGSQYAVLADEYSKLEPKAKAATARQDELNQQISASDTLMRNVDSRFYIAPVLDQILQSVPRSVQLTHVGAEVSADDKTRSSLDISGISSAVEPRKEAEALRTALVTKLGAKFKSANAVFKSLDDSDQVVILDGKRLPTANFTIQIQLVKTDADAAPAPEPVRKPRFASAQ